MSSLQQQLKPPHNECSMPTPTRPLGAISWSKTLHLPKSALPPRAPLPISRSLLNRCTNELYAWQRESRSKAKSFVLHDGPPYANGDLHIGHALNKILKDITCRFQISQGRRVHYVPGWDCHGLPIEIKALQALKAHHDDIGPVAVRDAARELAEETIENQQKGFEEWAVMGDWDNAYQTMEKGFEMRQLGVFKEMVNRGLIYRMRRPVYWSPSSGTALAEGELEYDEYHKSTAAFIAFPVRELSQKLQSLEGVDPNNLHALIWTTTPWTLPANQAIAVHKDLEYSIITLSANPTQQLLVGKARLEYLQSIFKLQRLEIVVDSIPGADIANTVKYSNPIRDGEALRPIISAEFVTASSGSGLVHMAPGHGMDDYNLCERLGIEALAPVDDCGNFTKDASPREPEILQGKSVQGDGPAAVVAYLRKLSKSMVLGTHDHRHKYPIDWRTKKPIIIRATEQWFANVEHLKEDVLRSIENVNFIPETGKHRLQSFATGRRQWCISRQRAWGVPIPALYNAETHEAVMHGSTIEHIMKVIEQRGIDAWWTDPEDDPAWIPPHLQDSEFVRGKDTMDVWFDSGTTWTLLPERDDNEPLADVYLEGSDQHRGWFQSSILTHIAHQQASGTSATPKAPYKTLITHGFTLDQDGRKMSKSLGNIISPSQITDGSLLPPVKRKKQKGVPTSKEPAYDAMGPDALRLWVASCDYTHDVSIGQPVLQGIQQSLHKYRVTFKWLLGALSDYYLPSSPLEWSIRRPIMIDAIVLHQLQIVSESVHASYTKYEYFKGVSALARYINLDLSAFYFETLKDRLYTGSFDERYPAQMVLHRIFNELLMMLAPITPLLVEEVWEHTPEQLKGLGHPMQRVWEVDTEVDTDGMVAKKLGVIEAAHSAIKNGIEELRAGGKVGSSLEVDVHLYIPDFEYATISTTIEERALFRRKDVEGLANIFVVSRVVVHDTPRVESEELVDGVERSFMWRAGEKGVECKAVITKASGDKCGRCWRYLELTPHGLCGRCEDVVVESHPNLLAQ
ncbi:isoleucyl-tRNA synthetase [Tothia fuscella]|uniref:Isoleucine--tRNA ligase, mitochondrial n=1 Tax=Tothia fuscella TaxID=1048955 RepID=A0A9P4P4D3_9PEZI|nr:isoleucyl-tRNA synthetase [Tothia fuscella]